MPDSESVRLHHRRGRQRRLRAGRSAHRVGPPSRAAVGGGPRQPASVAAYSARLRQAVHRSPLQLVLRDHPAARMPQPQCHCAARKSSRRLELDQRADLYPRPGGGLRPLAAARQCRLELCRRAALFPQGGKQRTRRRRIPRRRRAARRLGPARPASARRGLCRGGGAMRLSAQRRFQRRRCRKAPAITRPP